MKNSIQTNNSEVNSSESTDSIVVDGAKAELVALLDDYARDGNKGYQFYYDQILEWAAAHSCGVMNDLSARDAARYQVLRRHVQPADVQIQMRSMPSPHQTSEERIDMLCDQLLCNCPIQTPYGDAFCYECTGRALNEPEIPAEDSAKPTSSDIPTWQAKVLEQGGYVSDFKEAGKLMQAEIDALRAALVAQCSAEKPDMVRKYPDDLATAICRLARERGTPIPISKAQACLSQASASDAQSFRITELDKLEALARVAFKARDLTGAMPSIAGIRDWISEIRLSHYDAAQRLGATGDET